METFSYSPTDIIKAAKKLKSISSTVFKAILSLSLSAAILKAFSIKIINSVFIFIYGPVLLFIHLGLFFLFIFSIVY